MSTIDVYKGRMTCPYVGESTKSEIEYAKTMGKNVQYLETIECEGEI